MSAGLRKKYVQNSGLWPWIFPKTPSPVRGFWKLFWAALPALGPQFLSPLVTSRITLASATALGYGVLPSGNFKIPSWLRGYGWKAPPKNKISYINLTFFFYINQQNKDNVHRINNLTCFENCRCIIRNFISNTLCILTFFLFLTKNSKKRRCTSHTKRYTWRKLLLYYKEFYLKYSLNSHLFFLF